MVHEILPVGPLQCNCSIFGDPATGKALVVDPGDNIPQIERILEKHGLTVEAIVITHAHIDHIGGAQKLRTITGAPVYMNSHDDKLQDLLPLQAAWVGMRVPERTDIDSPLRDGDIIRAAGAEFHVLHTPGHTPGSISLWLPSETKLVAGDTLFMDSIGRTDLPYGDGPQLLRSIHDKYFQLPDETIVIPGHGPVTTLGREKEYNYFLQDL
jgi:hydroxyacylglutathione hydrolase